MQIDLLRQHISGYLGLRVEGEMDYRWSQESLGGEVEMFYIFIMVMVKWMSTFVKNHGIVHFK